LEEVALAHQLVESGKAAGRVVLMTDTTRASRR
jgi:hypothetical protein